MCQKNRFGYLSWRREVPNILLRHETACIKRKTWGNQICNTENGYSSASCCKAQYKHRRIFFWEDLDKWYYQSPETSRWGQVAFKFCCCKLAWHTNGTIENQLLWLFCTNCFKAAAIHILSVIRLNLIFSQFSLAQSLSFMPEYSKTHYVLKNSHKKSFLNLIKNSLLCYSG